MENPELTSLLSHPKHDSYILPTVGKCYNGLFVFRVVDFASLQCTVVHFEELLFLHLMVVSILN